MIKRLLIQIYFAFLLILPALASSETVVQYFTWRPAEKKLFTAISDQKLIPGVSIETHVIFEPNKHTYETHVTLELYNDNADIFEWPPGATKLQPLINEGLIAPYHGDLSMISSSALVAGLGTDGQYYGVPFAFQMESILVNKKLLRNHNIEMQPRDIASLEKRFDEIKQIGITPIQISGSVNWYVAQVVSEVLISGLMKEDFAKGLQQGANCFSSGEYRLVFETLKRWQDKGYFNSSWDKESYVDMNNAVALGNAAMSLNGGWMTGPGTVYWEADPKFEFGFWHVPGASGKVYVFSDGTYQINNKSSRHNAAEKVLEFTTTRKFAEMFARYVKQLPVYGGRYKIEEPLLAEMAALVSENSYPVSLFSAYSLNKGSPSYNDLVIKSIRGLLSGEMTPQQAALNVQSGLNSWNYVGTRNCR